MPVWWLSAVPRRVVDPAWLVARRGLAVFSARAARFRLHPSWSARCAACAPLVSTGSDSCGPFLGGPVARRFRPLALPAAVAVCGAVVVAGSSSCCLVRLRIARHCFVAPRRCPGCVGAVGLHGCPGPVVIMGGGQGHLRLPALCACCFSTETHWTVGKKRQTKTTQHTCVCLPVCLPAVPPHSSLCCS